MLLVVSITWPLVNVTLCTQNEKWNWCIWFALWIYSTLVFLSDSNSFALSSSLPISATPVWSIQNMFVALSCMLVLKEYYRAFALQRISVYLLPEISDYLSTSTAFIQTFVFKRKNAINAKSPSLLPFSFWLQYGLFYRCALDDVSVCVEMLQLVSFVVYPKLTGNLSLQRLKKLTSRALHVTYKTNLCGKCLGLFIQYLHAVVLNFNAQLLDKPSLEQH